MDHIVLDKLDGSMIHPAVVNEAMVFMTQMGLSDQSKRAWRRLHALSWDMLAAGCSPIFEYTSPRNRIVVAYDTDALASRAVRHTRTGI